MKEAELNPAVFGVKANEALVHQAYVTQLANERQVLAHTKDRSEVRGGGKKPWRQKGTGRARAGSSRSPIWRGGGVTFGPTKERNFKKAINKKMKKKALLMVLSDRAAAENLILLDQLVMAEFKTKIFSEMLKRLAKRTDKTLAVNKAQKPAVKKESKTRKDKPAKPAAQKAVKRSVLVIDDKNDKKVKYSGRNLAGVKMISLDNLNIVDLLTCRQVLLTVNGVKKLEERYGKSK